MNATARTCRDVILTLVAASRMADHVTVKGGVVMQQISGDRRRATRDIDLDFVRYPMTDGGIRGFIRALCPQDADVRLEVVGPIEELKHQDYHGKRVHLRITDSAGGSMETKLDLGVHDKLPLEQEELCIPDILERWSNLAGERKRVRTEKSFLVSKDEIVENDYDFSFSKYTETVHERVEYPPTEEILADLEAINQRIADGLSELREMLGGDGIA